MYIAAKISPSGILNKTCFFNLAGNAMDRALLAVKEAFGLASHIQSMLV
jgi:hypothetical protein